MGARGAMPWLMALLAFQASLSAPIQEVAGAADMGNENPPTCCVHCGFLQASTPAGPKRV